MSISIQNKTLYNNIIKSLQPLKMTLFTKLLELKKIKIDDKTFLRKIQKIKKK